MQAFAFENILDHHANLGQLSSTIYMKAKVIREQDDSGDMYDSEVIEVDEKKIPLKKVYTVNCDSVVMGLTGGHLCVLLKGDKIELLASGKTGHGTSFNVLRSKYKSNSIAYREDKRFAQVQNLQIGAAS